MTAEQLKRMSQEERDKWYAEQDAAIEADFAAALEECLEQELDES